MTPECLREDTETLRMLHPSEQEPVSHLTADDSVVVVESEQMEKIRERNLAPRKRPAFRPDPRITEEMLARSDPFDAVAGRRLRFVVCRGLLGKDRNFAYVFAGEPGLEPMMAGIGSKVRTERAACRPTAWTRAPGTRSVAWDPCDCQNWHFRALRTVMHGIDAGKAAFLDGAALRHGLAFDPVNHCEWFYWLPQDWSAFSAGNAIIIDRPLLGRTSWLDASLARRLEGKKRTIRVLGRSAGLVEALSIGYLTAARASGESA